MKRSMIMFLSATLASSIAAAPAVAATKWSKAAAFRVGHDSGESIGSSHPGSPNGQRILIDDLRKVPVKYRADFKRGWRKGAYVTYLTAFNFSAANAPSMTDVFRTANRPSSEPPTRNRFLAPARQLVAESPGGLGIPSSGKYYAFGQTGFKRGFFYDDLRNGFYRVRDLSGDNRNANPFDKGTVVSQAELYKTLVETGALKP